MENINEFKRKTVIITGGAKGIGKAIALELLKEKCRVIILDIDKIEGRKLQNDINDMTEFINIDISKEEQVKEASENITSKYKKIDILINNAAKQTENKFFEMSVKEFREVVDTNLIGTFICSNILGRKMKKGSKIINMLSVHYNKPRKNKCHYDAPKAGIAMLTQEMVLELSDSGITVNGISYGACNTPMNSNWINDNELVNKTLNKIPLKWIAKPEEISRFTTVILKEFSDYTTGSIFNIDGGREFELVGILGCF